MNVLDLQQRQPHEGRKETVEEISLSAETFDKRVESAVHNEYRYRNNNEQPNRQRNDGIRATVHDSAPSLSEPVRVRSVRDRTLWTAGTVATHSDCVRSMNDSFKAAADAAADASQNNRHHVTTLASSAGNKMSKNTTDTENSSSNMESSSSNMESNVDINSSSNNNNNNNNNNVRDSSRTVRSLQKQLRQTQSELAEKDRIIQVLLQSNRPPAPTAISANFDVVRHNRKRQRSDRPTPSSAAISVTANTATASANRIRHKEQHNVVQDMQHPIIFNRFASSSSSPSSLPPFHHRVLATTSLVDKIYDSRDRQGVKDIGSNSKVNCNRTDTVGSTTTAVTGTDTAAADAARSSEPASAPNSADTDAPALRNGPSPTEPVVRTTPPAADKHSGSARPSTSKRPSSTSSTSPVPSSYPSTAPSSSRSSVSSSLIQSIQEWILLEGGRLPSVKSFMSKYCQLVRNTHNATISLPVDRLFMAGMLPQSSAYTWKWEYQGEQQTPHWQEREVSQCLFDTTNDDTTITEPFALLKIRRADQYRLQVIDGDSTMSSSSDQRRQQQQKQRQNVKVTLGSKRAGDRDGSVPQPQDFGWFFDNGYRDYLALPILHDGQFKGAMAWATKQGFSDTHVHVIRESLHALQVVLRLHTNDLILHSLTAHLEDQVQERTQELESANAQLAKANLKVKTQSQIQLAHFAMMSHEIRTPLNCIVGLSSLLLEGAQEEGLPDSTVDSIRMITQSGDLLLAIVNDVLDYSKLEAGKVDLLVGPTKLQQTLQVVVESIRIKATQQQEQRNGPPLEVITNIDDNDDRFIVPDMIIETDGRRLQQILYNLLGNAIKFGRDGGKVEFHTSIVESSAIQLPATSTTLATTSSQGENHSKTTGFNYIQFSIKDFGPGISQENMKNLFQPFQQAHIEPVAKSRRSHSTDGEFGGTGLGLAITSKLVNRLGGNIHVLSEVGKWTQFIVNLPLVVSSPPRPLSLSSAFNASNGVLKDHSQSKAAKQDQPKSKRARIENLLGMSKVTAKSVDKAPPAIAQIYSDKKRVSSLTSISENVAVLKEGLLHQQSETNDRMTSTACKRKEEKSLSEVSILIAEDNIVNQKVLKRSLQRVGLKLIDVANNGKEAVDMSAKTSYDIIFMDLQMPEMDGLEATAIIKQREQALHPHSEDDVVKIIFVTAHALQEFQEKAEAVGGDGFISKPFKLDEIRNLFLKLRIE